ncbi:MULTISPECIES: cytochrome b [Rhizobium]|uniref:Cytochrome b561 n=1 Tax=Rhizobium paranaense TaxID=1650438 RepID=A0A7W8XQF2_9HYPH|nr:MULTISPECIES: cytochrome b [Rhizobium]MBB5573717.1 cytochrome b561 [Rhizobium paranaense]PST61543.1 cytochrome B [Rhizobium sp. SEMIA4064]
MSNFNIAAADKRAARYDHFTIALHWLTAFLVLTLFALAEARGFVARGTPLRGDLIFVHISLGVLLAAVLILRIVWRVATRQRTAPAVSGLQHVVATLTHLALYALMISQVSYGFLMIWVSGNGPSFFGLFSVPPLLVLDQPTRHLMSELHDYTAWAIIAIAGTHAAAALMHHYVLRDRVLVRMIPARG